MYRLTDAGNHAVVSKGEAARHKADLEALKQQDPEFYAYLDQTDRGLLDFDLGSDASDGDSEENEAAEAELQADQAEDSEGGPEEVCARAAFRACSFSAVLLCFKEQSVNGLHFSRRRTLHLKINRETMGWRSLHQVSPVCSPLCQPFPGEGVAALLSPTCMLPT